MTLDEHIFWWLTLALFVWFAAFPAHAAFQQTAESSGYGIDELPNTVPEGLIIASYTINNCGADVCATLYPTQLAAEAAKGFGPRIYTARELIVLIEHLESKGDDASVSRAALADLVKTKIILKK